MKDKINNEINDVLKKNTYTKSVLKQRKYLIWIESGFGNIAEIKNFSRVNNSYTVIHPHHVVNTLYGELENKQKVSINHPGVIKTGIDIEMSPYFFNECVGDKPFEFVINASNVKYSVIKDSEEHPLLKQFKFLAYGEKD